MEFAWAAVVLAAFTVLYAYAIYPLTLAVVARLRAPRAAVPVIADGHWPTISITIPVYNEVAQIDSLLQAMTNLDYPKDRIQILFVSDASTDGTDERIQAYAAAGVELLRMPTRGGKTAAENAARPLLRGEIIINTDASIRIHPNAIKPMVARFRDPEVGLASGRDVSVARAEGSVNIGESTYVGYEMWVRHLETQLYGIVGASGCFYAIRRDLHQEVVPVALSRDFAAALVTREHGLRPVTVNESICYVPRVPSIRHEHRRKVRTITRGMETLYFKRALLNPWTYGVFSWMLFSHKICRWLSSWAALIGVAGLIALAPTQPLALAGVAGVAAVMGTALIGWNWPEGKGLPRVISIPTFLIVGNLAVIQATIKALRGELNAVWEPTRRDPAAQQPSVAANV
jgi:cellulose synthase/poly-beta-1,6-N-acetylglucosamine synthase-like glycosyltransferase